jgi:hypothetical protein
MTGPRIPSAGKLAWRSITYGQRDAIPEKEASTRDVPYARFALTDLDTVETFTITDGFSKHTREHGQTLPGQLPVARKWNDLVRQSGLLLPNVSIDILNCRQNLSP